MYYDIDSENDVFFSSQIFPQLEWNTNMQDHAAPQIAWDMYGYIIL